MTRAWAEKYGKDGIVFTSLHPGQYPSEFPAST